MHAGDLQASMHADFLFSVFCPHASMPTCQQPALLLLRGIKLCASTEVPHVISRQAVSLCCC